MANGLVLVGDGAKILTGRVYKMTDDDNLLLRSRIANAEAKALIYRLSDVSDFIRDVKWFLSEVGLFDGEWTEHYLKSAHQKAVETGRMNDLIGGYKELAELRLNLAREKPWSADTNKYYAALYITRAKELSDELSKERK